MTIDLFLCAYLHAFGVAMLLVLNLKHNSTFFGSRPLWWGVLWVVLWPVTILICLLLVIIDPEGRIFKYLPGGD